MIDYFTRLGNDLISFNGIFALVLLLLLIIIIYIDKKRRKS